MEGRQENMSVENKGLVDGGTEEEVLPSPLNEEPMTFQEYSRIEQDHLAGRVSDMALVMKMFYLVRHLRQVIRFMIRRQDEKDNQATT